MLLNFFCAILIWVCMAAFGSGSAGNGGDVVVCRENGVLKSIEVLDLYESREMYGVDVDLEKGNFFEEKVFVALDRLWIIDPARAVRYQEWALEFKEEALFKKNIVLTDINDSKHVAIPVGCKIEQIAIQRKPLFPEQKRYLISQDLWDLLDEKNRAALILHEIIYREALEMGHEDSIATRRYFSGAIGEMFDPSHVKDYVEFLIYVEFLNFTYRGIQLDLDSSLTFFEDGSIESATAHQCSVKINYQQVEVLPSAVVYYGSGMISSVHTWKIEIHNKTVGVDSSYPVSFYEVSQRVKEIKVGDNSVEIGTKTYNPGEILNFYDYWNGAVIEKEFLAF